MANEDEKAVGFQQILEILRKSRSQFYDPKRKPMSLRDELQQAGAIFYQRHRRKCCDGKLRQYVCVWAFPSRIRNWISIKASKGEIIQHENRKTFDRTALDETAMPECLRVNFDK